MQHRDLTRDEALIQANTLATQGWEVYFKFTCSNCGERVILDEPNTLYESGECCVCGRVMELSRVGFLLLKKL